MNDKEYLEEISELWQRYHEGQETLSLLRKSLDEVGNVKSNDPYTNQVKGTAHMKFTLCLDITNYTIGLLDRLEEDLDELSSTEGMNYLNFVEGCLVAYRLELIDTQCSIREYKTLLNHTKENQRDNDEQWGYDEDLDDY